MRVRNYIEAAQRHFPSYDKYFQNINVEVVIEINVFSDKLSKKLNKKVDLVSRKFLNKYIKPYVQKDLITIYGQG